MPRRFLAILILVFVWQPASAAGVCGVVFMHGKWGSPDKWITEVTRQLHDIGCAVETPEMPWSGRRLYDAPVIEALRQIDAAVAALRSTGATAIFVGGHSMGASAAIGYAAQRPGLAGVIAVAPGHDPSLPGLAAKFAGDVARTREMVAAGRGLETGVFEDFNGGRGRTISTTAAIFLDYFAPGGLFDMPANAARLSAPLLWVSGDRDPLARLGEGYAFGRAPTDPRNQYLTVSADHLGTPDEAARQIAAWVQPLFH